MQKEVKVKPTEMTSKVEWQLWHGRLIRYWQSLGVGAGGLVNPFNGDVYTIANLTDALIDDARKAGMTPSEYAADYLYSISQRKKP